MKIPDITGFSLDDAEEILKDAGVNQLQIVVTAPPKFQNSDYQSFFRVVRQKNINDSNIIELVVCNITP